MTCKHGHVDARRTKGRQCYECLRVAVAKWQAAHPSQVLANAKCWQAAHPERVKFLKQRWQKANPEVYRQQARQRRALKLAAAGESISAVDLESLFRFQAGRCVYCTTELTLASRHLDHVTPIASGGTHHLSNLSWACALCNRRKHAKTVAKFLKILHGETGEHDRYCDRG